MIARPTTLRTRQSGSGGMAAPEKRSGSGAGSPAPGVPTEKLDVRTEGDMLIIEGEIVLEMPTGMKASHVKAAQDSMADPCGRLSLRTRARSLRPPDGAG
jgi:hypothetical protein